jgi:hypothetical protein
MGRAVRYLAGEAGIRQFLDIGTGLPTADSTHEIAQQVAPESRIVYVDNDPVVLLHAHALLRGAPQGATDYLDADLRDPGAIIAGQISHQLTVLQDTTVTVQDNGPANDVAPPGANPPVGFPADADAVARRINGVTAAGVWWPVTLPPGTTFTGSLALSAPASQTTDLLAASPGAVQAMGLRMTAGTPLTAYENDTSQHVAVIDTATAAALGISPARLASRPAVFVDGIAYTVIGVYSSAQRVVTNSSAMLIPETTALADFGNPQPGIGNQDEARWSSRPGSAPRRRWPGSWPRPNCRPIRGGWS